MKVIKADPSMTGELREIWKTCFPQNDPRYTDFYFKAHYKPENCYVMMDGDKPISAAIRNPHALMFNGRVLQTSMIMGVATIPEEQRKGYMRELMKIVLDACEHTELLTLIQTEEPKLYEPMGFRTIYHRRRYTIERKDVHRTTNFGCSFDPAPLDLLKVYSAFIRRFNGFYPRDLEYFVRYKQEVNAQGGKIVAFYNGKDQIRGYAVMIPMGEELIAEEIVYLDAACLNKLCNACVQEKKTVHLLVSEAEDLSRVFPEAKSMRYPSTMVRLNDADLFSKLFNRRIETVEEAFAISQRPLNLNEFA